MSPAVLALLPGWLPLAATLLPLLLSLLGAVILGRLSFYVCFRKFPTEAHWTERARMAWGGRRAAGTALLVMPILMGMVVAFNTGSVSIVPGWLNGTLAGLVWAGVAFADSRRLGRLLGFPAVPVLVDLRRTLASFYRILLVLGLLALILYLGNRGLRGEFWLGLVALALTPLLVRRELYLVGRPLRFLGRPDERLLRVVASAAQKVGHTPSAVDVLEVGVPNAFALLFSNAILVTRRLPEVLDDAGLEAVIAHELGHLSESRTARLLRLVPLTVILVGVLAVLQTSSDHLLLAYLLFILALLGAVFLSRKLGRRLEQRADAVAHEATPEYALALETIYRENLLPAHVVGGTHPSLYDRMVASGVTPEWPRPALPTSGALRAMVLLYLLVPVATMFLSALLWGVLDRGPLSWFNLVTGHDEAWALSEMGMDAFEAGRPEDARMLYGEAERMEPEVAWYPANLALVEAGLGHCAAAQEAAGRAQARVRPDDEWQRTTVQSAVDAAAECGH